MGEKLSYYNRKLEAINSGGKIWSFIFDGMSSSSTQLPYLGNSAQFGSGFATHLQGCISHAGNETTFYWTYPNVMTGSSFMIHCIFTAIEKALADGKDLPDKVYIQIDGGSENVAKSVYAALEHLVYKRFCKRIIISRLPVGHTHEDIDSRFGKIWAHIRTLSIYTLEEFEKAIRRAFAGNKVFVVAVIAIMDYGKYYEQFVDKKFSNYAKEEWTQHQFKIEYNYSENCKSIVLTNYRKFSQDMVCFLRPIASVDLSEANKLSWCNYWPVMLKSQYLPENAIGSECSPGMSFLAIVPTGTPLPMEFTSWADDFAVFMRSMKKRFKNVSESWIIKSWQNFAFSVMPHKICDLPTSAKHYPGTYKRTSDCVADYIKNCDEIETPLGHILYNPNNEYIYV
jgi:hypothetical protein